MPRRDTPYFCIFFSNSPVCLLDSRPEVVYYIKLNKSKLEKKEDRLDYNTCQR
jgi:hypothetical protein